VTDKELHKLNRRELLQLMLDQGRRAEELQQSLEETQTELEELQNNYERLRKRLDHKDVQIKQLRELLQAERVKREIELEEAGSIAEAALRLNGVFEAAQKAAEQYIYNVRLLHDRCQREEANLAVKDPAGEQTQAEEPTSETESRLKEESALKQETEPRLKEESASKQETELGLEKEPASGED